MGNHQRILPFLVVDFDFSREKIFWNAWVMKNDYLRVNLEIEKQRWQWYLECFLRRLSWGWRRRRFRIGRRRFLVRHFLGVLRGGMVGCCVYWDYWYGYWDREMGLVVVVVEGGMLLCLGGRGTWYGRKGRVECARRLDLNALVQEQVLVRGEENSRCHLEMGRSVVAAADCAVAADVVVAAAGDGGDIAYWDHWKYNY